MRKKMHRGWIALSAVAVIAAAGAFVLGSANAAIDVDPPINTLTPQQEAVGWELLFDGENPAEHWRGYNQDDLPDGWQVIEDGWLALEEPGAGDIITHEEYGSFELFMEWVVEDGSNSGIFYLTQETDGPIWHSAPEYQILDNAPTQSPITAAGSLFDLIGSTVWDEVERPTGEVNTARIVKRGDYVEHHMNGRKLFSFEIGTEEWDEMVEESKFNAPPFATADEGHIGLQDHGDWVAFRNIRIRPLDE